MRNPPRLAEVLLRLVLPSDGSGESILRELRTEYRSVSRRVRFPRMWYWREALALAFHFALHRARFGPGRPSSGPGGANPLESLGRDLRYALRRLVGDAAFSVMGTATIALGIGATVLIYSVVDAVLLDPLPYEDPEELVAVWEWNVPRDVRENVVNPGNFRDWRERSETLEGMAAVTLPAPVVMQGGADPEEVSGRFVSGNFFQLLGVEAEVGRLPVADPDLETPEVVLSQRLWHRTFGGDPGVVGRSVTLNGRTGVIVGVLPSDYLVFAGDADILTAVSIRGDQTSAGRFLNVVGRLSEGVTVETAREEMEAIAAGLREEYPEYNGGWSVNLVPLHEVVVGDVRATLWFLMGAVGLLLTIACLNVANLFLARAERRRREMAVRISLGAGVGRLTAQLLVESMVLACVGALLGVGLAHLGLGLITGVLLDVFALPRVEGAGIDGGVLAFAAAVTGLTAVVFGTAPSLVAARPDPASTLSSGRRAAGDGPGQLRDGLVVFEVALSVVLLAGAGLLGRSFVSLTAVDPGVDASGVLVGRVTAFGPEYADAEPRQRLFSELVRRVGEIPGVEAVGGATFLPLTGLAAATNYYVEGRPVPPREGWPAAEVRNVVGDYFGAMGIKLLRGRTFDRRDSRQARDVVIVNRSLAERHWPAGDAVGERIRLQWAQLEDLEVVGVVEDVHHYGLDREPRPMAYVPYAQKAYFSSVNLTVRSEVLEPGTLARSVEEEVRALDPALTFADVAPMEALVAESVAQPRMTAALTGFFALLAATLAAVGLYGVLAYTVSRRLREIGVRMALGADGRHVMRLVLRQGFGLTALGVGLGLAVTVVAAPVVRGLLFGVRATDVPSLAGAAALLMGVATVACLVPAWRATRVPPSEVLRGE